MDREDVVPILALGAVLVVTHVVVGLLGFFLGVSIGRVFVLA